MCVALHHKCTSVLKNKVQTHNTLKDYFQKPYIKFSTNAYANDATGSIARLHRYSSKKQVSEKSVDRIFVWEGEAEVLFRVFLSVL